MTKTISTFFFLLGGIAASSCAYRTYAQEENVIASVVVLDAGSSGTRIHVYDFTSAEDAVPTMDLKKSESQTKKIKPGLSRIARNMDESTVDDIVARNLEPLIEYARSIVPDSRERATPILLKATAGLRAVRSDRRDRVILAARRALSKSGFLFKDEWADVIPGVEEGGLAWVTANYLQGALARKSSLRPLTTTGVVEMGGGSTQVTFAIFPESKFESLSPRVRYIFRDLEGRAYKIYALSYIGYGGDYAQTTYYEKLTSEGSSTQDPCCQPERSCDPNTKLVGTGDYAACMERIRDFLFSAEADLDGDEVLVPGVGRETDGTSVLQPELTGPFLATENFFYVRNDVVDVVSIPRSMTMDIDAASTLGKEVCGTNRDVISVDDRKKLCFMIAYETVLLEELGLKTKVPGEMTPKVTRTIGGIEADWAVGAAVVHFIENANMLYRAHAAETRASSAWGRGISDNTTSSPRTLLLVGAIVFLFAIAVRKYHNSDSIPLVTSPGSGLKIRAS